MSRVFRVFALTVVLVVSSVTFFVPATAMADSGTSRVTCDATFSQGTGGFQQVVEVSNCESSEDNWPHVVLVIAGGAGTLIAFALIIWWVK